MLPGKNGLLCLVTWQKGRLNKYGVKVVLNTRMTLEMIQAEKPDEVVISIYGSKVVMIELENEILKGMDHHNKKIEGTAKFIELD